MKDTYTILKTGRYEITRVAIDAILYLKAFGNYTDIVLDNGRKLTICQNIKHTLNYINSTCLIRINRSTAINNSKIIGIKNGKKKIVKLANNHKLNYSTNYISNPNDLLA